VSDSVIGETYHPATSPSAQIRKAWLVLIVCAVVCIAVMATASVAAVWVYRHSTTPETARLQIVSGGGALVRSPGDSDWRLINVETRVGERDQISTALGTVVWLTTFDGSTIEIAEDTIISINRMRSSRFLNRTKLVDIELDRGAVYVGMVSRNEFVYSEFVIRAGDNRIVMSDEGGRDGSGSFLVEVSTGVAGAASNPSVRAAVLRGSVRVTSPVDERFLDATQQVIVNESGAFGPITTAIRELLTNGSFEHGLTPWVTFVIRSPLAPESQPVGAAIDLVHDRTPRGDAVAVELLKVSDTRNSAAVGVRQRIVKTIRLQSSLQLDFDVKISDQQPPSSGADLTQFPLIFEINYVDANGQENRWSHGYYILTAQGATIPRDRATRLERDKWQRIVFDLRNLSPLPRQITSLVVYASGESYQTRVANISLSSAELIDPE
jgi:hypothetical protein